jgi:bifunctional DNA-binding transcriptional regulator/antitoxin component of YhaV-PrlF toxin-antitoxin module
VGRLTVPKRFRDFLGMEKGERVYFSMENEFIILRREGKQLSIEEKEKK